VGGLSNLLKEMRQFNKLETQLSEQEQNVVQLENWNAVLTQQIEELQGQQQDKEEAISELK
jgi:cell division protein FtsB